MSAPREHQCVDGEWSTGETFWLNDGNGIPLCRACDRCDRCERQKLAKYRPEILRPYDSNDVDEQIEEDRW